MDNRVAVLGKILPVGAQWILLAVKESVLIIGRAYSRLTRRVDVTEWDGLPESEWEDRRKQVAEDRQARFVPMEDEDDSEDFLDIPYNMEPQDDNDPYSDPYFYLNYEWCPDPKGVMVPYGYHTVHLPSLSYPWEVND